MTSDEFDEQFKPIKNPHDKDAGWDGCLFGITGAEHNFVRGSRWNHVWTLTSHGTLISGYHWVDRVGYIVTEEPWKTDTEVQP